MSTTNPSAAQPRRTPLYDRHVALGARVIDFGGWAMPVQYESILEEHKTVHCRRPFRRCHMGEVEFVGPGALAAVERLVSNDVRKAGRRPGHLHRCLLRRRWHRRRLHRLSRSRRANRHRDKRRQHRQKDVAWFQKHVEGRSDVVFRNLSDDYGLIAVQGPLAVPLCFSVSREAELSQSQVVSFLQDRRIGIPVWAARTGIIPGDGFEVFVPAAQTARLWDAMLTVGKDLGVKPCGLGARDTLRLKRACLCTAMTSTRRPIRSANLGWVVKLDHDFIGRSRSGIKARVLRASCACFTMEGRGTARHGYGIFDAETGGNQSASSLRERQGQRWAKNIGLGYVPLQLAEVGARLFIDCRGKRVAAQVVKSPFYRRPAIQRGLAHAGPFANQTQTGHVPMSKFPTDLRYTKDHEWARIDGKRAPLSASPTSQCTSLATSPKSICPKRASRSVASG